MSYKKVKFGIVVCLCIVFSLVLPTVSATTIDSITLEVYPKQGDISTDIFVQVRSEPYNGEIATATNDAPFLYLYFDDKVIVQRIKCVIKPKWGDYSYYEVSYDAKIKVPNEYPYSELGKHKITAIVEASDKTKATTSTTFEVVNYIAPPDWWEDLPQDFVDSITGPPGLIGPKGDKGEQGEVSLIVLLIAIFAVTIVFVVLIVYLHGKISSLKNEVNNLRREKRHY